MPYTITVGENLSPTQQKQLNETINATFSHIDTHFNNYNPQSEVSVLNTLPARQKISISPSMAQFLHQVDTLVTQSDNIFDPTIAPVHALWKQHLKHHTTPSHEEIALLTPAIGWNTIHFDNNTFYKDHDATQLDFGGIAKGHCVDLISEKLIELGYSHHIVDWGGELKAHGHHPSGRQWIVGISHPDTPDPSYAIAHVPLHNQALATSGNYLQNWKVEGTTFTHIIDPTTLKPLTVENGTLTSCSVIADTCMEADTLATRAIIFQAPEKAHQWAKEMKSKNPNLSFWFATKHQ